MSNLKSSTIPKLNGNLIAVATFTIKSVFDGQDGDTANDGTFSNGIDSWSTSSTDYIKPNGDVNVSSSGESQKGGNILEITGEEWLHAKHYVPIETNKIYKMTIRVKQNIDPMSGGKKFYSGAVVFNENKGFNSGNGGRFYFCTSSLDTPRTWTEYTKYVSLSKPNTGREQDNAVAIFPAGTKYVKPMFIVNYQSSSGVAAVDYCTFEDATEEYNAIQRTPDDVFNSLTNNGRSKGIGYDNKEDFFWFNGDYVKAGKVKADYIDALGLTVKRKNTEIKTLEITPEGEVNLNVKNFTLVAGGNSNIPTQDQVNNTINQELDKLSKLDKALIIDNTNDKYWPFDMNLLSTAGSNPDIDNATIINNKGIHGNAVAIEESITNIFAPQHNPSSFTAKAGSTMTTDTFKDDEVIYKYTSSSSSIYEYWGRDITVDTTKEYTLSCWIYVSTDYNSTITPTFRGEQGFSYDTRYDLSKKGTWQYFTISKKPTTTTARILMYPKTSTTSNGSAGYILFKNPMFSQTGCDMNTYTSSTKPSQQLSYNLTVQEDKYTMMSYKQHILQDKYYHHALTRNGSTFTYYRDGVAYNGYKNKWTLYKIRGITTPSTDGKTYSKYISPFERIMVNDPPSHSHAWNTVKYGLVARTFVYAARDITINHKYNYDNYGLVAVNGIVIGTGSYNSNGNPVAIPLVKGWNCIEICYVDGDSGGNFSMITTGSDAKFSQHTDILYMTAEMPIEFMKNKIHFGEKSNCLVDEMVVLNKVWTSDLILQYYKESKTFIDLNTKKEINKPSSVTMSIT